MLNNGLINTCNSIYLRLQDLLANTKIPNIYIYKMLYLIARTHYLAYYAKTNVPNNPSFPEVIYFSKKNSYEMIKLSIILYMI